MYLVRVRKFQFLNAEVLHVCRACSGNFTRIVSVIYKVVISWCNYIKEASDLPVLFHANQQHGAGRRRAVAD